MRAPFAEPRACLCVHVRMYAHVRVCECVYVGLLAASKFVTNRELYLIYTCIHAHICTSRSPFLRKNLEEFDDGFECNN